MKNYTVLIVDDEPKLAEAVEAYLRADGFCTITAGDGRQALALFEREKPDMAILDLMLPFVSGEEVCRTIRKRSRIPIIMLTAKANENSKIDGLNMGADDYITKPFSPRELVARVNCLARRCGGADGGHFGMLTWEGGLTADLDAHTVKKDGIPVNLTQSEYNLFATLALHPNRIFTRGELIEHAFGDGFDGFDRTVDSHIKNLRGKIEADTADPVYILTVRSVGYRFGGKEA